MKIPYSIIFISGLLVFFACNKDAKVEPISFKHPFGSIPDPVFEKILIDKGIDKDKTVNGKMDPNDALSITELKLTNKNISSLDGIEMFTNLTFLSCGENKITELDLRNNVNLEELYCSIGNVHFSRPDGNLFKGSGIALTKLDVSRCSSLKILECVGNEISSLDLSTMTELVELDIMSNKLTSIDLTNATELETLNCGYNLFKDLNLTNCKSLKTLDAYNNKITDIDLSKLPNLEYIDVFKNQLNNLDVSKNPLLREIDCSQNNFKILSFKNNSNLETLYCYQNQIETINISLLQNLKHLDLRNNSLTNIDLSNNKKLIYITLHFCKNISTIDVTKNLDLVNLNCQYTNLKKLDLRKNLNLQSLATAGVKNLEICVNNIEAATLNKNWYKDISSFYSKCD